MRDVTTLSRANRSWFRGDVALDPSVTLLDPGLFAAVPVELVIRRPDDLLVLRLRLFNLSIAGPADARRIAVIDKAKSGYLAVYHQPQSFAEQVYLDSSPSDLPSALPPGSLPAAIRISGPSRVVHRFPNGMTDWDGSQRGLLSAMANWPLQHVPLGLPTAGRDLSPFATLVSVGAGAAVMTANPLLAAGVGRAVRRAVQAMTALTPSSATEVAADLGLAVATMAADAGLTKTTTQAAIQAAELQLAGSIGNRFADRIGFGDIVAAIPGLRLLFKPRVPSAIETAIEIPYRLAMSPIDDAVVFSHAIGPVTLGTGRPRTELWHSRLGTLREAQRKDATEEAVALAAIWTPDLATTGNEPTFDASLSKDERIDLVSLSADETLHDTRGRPYHPTPAWSDRLMLTALGGWLDLQGKWDVLPLRPDGKPISLFKWSHHAALGRDYAVETAHIGHLVPFGNRASVVKITERRFEPHADGGRVASLRQLFRIVVLEQLRDFPMAGQPAEGRELPFNQVEILTRQSKKLISPPDPTSFWPQIQIGPTPTQVEDFRFAVRATDLSGAVVRFNLPMRFVSDSAPMSAAVADYNGVAQSVAKFAAKCGLVTRKYPSG